jgi:succinoglycan biosynthesis transport protein ExoP
MNDRNPSSPRREERGGYSYAGGDNGYAAVGYGDTPAQRTIRDYALIVRERIWYVIVVFLVVFSGCLVYTLSRTKLYDSVATVMVLRRDPVVMKVEGVVENEIRSAEDLNTQVKLLESGAIIQKVAERLSGEELLAFMKPYERGGSGDPVTPIEVLGLNRKIFPLRQTLMIAIQYTHPDRLMAARVSNLFAEEYLAYVARVRIDESMRAVEDLKQRADDQSKRVQELGINLQAYKERNNMVSLDERKDIVTEKLKALNLLLTQNAARMREAEIRWRQIEEFREQNRELTELSFVASQPLIAQLNQQLAAQKIQIAQLGQRYRERHPRMLEATHSLTQTRTELNRAIESVALNIRSEYEAAIRNFDEARRSLEAQEQEALKLDRLSVEYGNLQNELLVNEHLLQSIMVRMRETAMQSTIETQNARIVDRAVPALRHSSPNIPLYLGLGVFGGLGLGLAFAFFIAFIDDRVKSAFDIESVVGLPLIGIIPQVRRMDTTERAQIVMNNADRQVSEAFLTLHSSLRLKDESKNAQVVLVTSTIPGEGKSFVTSNLALTYASHGERTILIDCDLRKPTVHKSMGIENHKGVIDYCTIGAALDELIVKNRFPNLDVLPAGGRAKNPTQILNGKNFEVLLAELRKRYDRVFIDTPPLAAVSDAVIILPMVDGSIFTILFNQVRRKAAQFASRKLLEANVPCFGAVLNGLNLSVSGYYYAQYYDKSYKDYYVVMGETSEPASAGKS